MQQTIRYLTTPDGVRLAWATSGSGVTMVKASNWITHLEYDWESPVWRHWIKFLSEHFRLVRYDERGCGLSQQDVDDVGTRHWMPDLEAVVDAARLAEPFVLLGVSQGACAAIEYAVAHPERVAKMILYGGYAKGWARRGNPDHVREGNALLEFTELGWGRADPLYRRLFTKRFLPEASEEQLSWFDELCARTVQPKMAARLMRARGDAEVRHLLGRVQVPTLVLHASGDCIVPFADGQELAAGIPGAEFVQLDSPNHILLEHEPATQRLHEAVLAFTGVGSQAEDPVFGALSGRERDILARICSGMTNVEIGARLFISEKTVRNHVTRIFDKLGVRTRAQAIVFARDRNFRAAAEGE